MNCLIIEDESLAAEILKDYINDIPGLELVAICPDVLKATEILRHHAIDILFIDIHLPRISGIDFAKTLKDNYHIIFTTAYHQYAVEGFNINAVDYLLKPVAFSRFLQAVQKVFDRAKPADAAGIPGMAERRFHFFNVDKKQVKVYSDEVLYIESLKDYVRIHLKGRRISTRFQIGELEKVLEPDLFFRVHKSYIVNIRQVTAYTASEVELGDIALPIGRMFKEQVEMTLRSKSTI